MRKACVAALLLWVALWPLAHRGLVALYDVNPWKLSGWAMYTVPTPPVLVALFREDADGLAPLREASLPEGVRRALDRFRVERHALGRLRRPDEVGAAVLRARGDLPWVLVVVQKLSLDPDTARMTSHKDTYLYEP